MINSIVNFMSNVTTSAVNFAMNLFDQTGTWSLVFAGISVILICRFLLGPILGFTVTGASDMVSSKISQKSSKNTSEPRNRLEPVSRSNRKSR